MYRFIPIIPIALATTWMASCQAIQPEETANSGVFNVVVAAQVANQCAAGNQGEGEFPLDVDRFVMTVTGATVNFQVDVPNTALNPEGRVLIQHVPPGDNLTLDLYGCSGDKLSWSGRSTDVIVTKNEKTAPGIFLTKKNVFNCPGSTLDSIYDWRPDLNRGFVFGAAVNTANNGVLITGGFDAAELNTSILTLTANPTGSGSILEYQATKGLFRTWEGMLNYPRGLHHAIAFDSGKQVLIVGGVTSADVRSAPWAPVGPERIGSDRYDEQILPEQRFEVANLNAQTVTAYDMVNIKSNVLPLSAMATGPATDAFVMSGGIQSNGEPSNHVIYVPNIPAALADPQTVVTGQLTQARMGHTMSFIGSNSPVAFVIGGNYDPDPVANALAEMVVLPSSLDGSTPIQSFPIDNMSRGGDTTYSTAFHQTILLESAECSASFLVAGGLSTIEKTQSSISTPKYAFFNTPPTRLDRIDLTNTCQVDSTLMNVTPLVVTGQTGGIFDDTTRMQRALHSLTDLGDGVILVGGGFKSMSGALDSSYCDQDAPGGCFYADTPILHYNPMEVPSFTLEGLNPTLTFSHSRLGHSTLVLPDGTLLALGGLRCTSSPDCLTNDAEIFNPARPSDASVCTSPPAIIPN